MRPGVNAQRRKVVAEAMFHVDPKRVIIRVQSVINARDIRIKRAGRRIHQIKRAPLCRVARGRSSRYVDRRVLFLRSAQMGRLVADIGGGEQQIPCQLPLVTQIPLFHVHVVQIERQRDVLRGRAEGSRLRGWIGCRERIAAGETRVRVGEASQRRDERNRAAPRRRSAEVPYRVGFGSVEEHAPGRANTLLSIAVQVPGEADSRREVHVTAIRVRGRDSRVAVEQQAERRVVVHARFLARLERRQREMVSPARIIVLRKRWLPTHAHMEVQALPHLHIVLKIRPVITFPQRDLDRVSLRERTWTAQYKIGQRVARKRAVERPAAVTARDVHLVHLDRQHLNAKAQMMAPANNVHIVGVLKLIAGEVCRRV